MDKKELEKYLQAIIQEKKPVYVISPHADDAALSMGGLLSFLSKKTKVEVITLFTQSSDAISLSARQFLKQCRYKNAKKLFEERAKEDYQAFKNTHVKITHLNFTEALFRKKRKQNMFMQIIGKAIPEVSLLYPTYQFHIAKGNIHKEDKLLIDDIGERLQEIIKNKHAVVFAPLGLGNHIDHKIAKLAAKKYFNPIYYFDQPYYNRLNSKELLGYPFAFQNEKDLDKKSVLVSSYKTQIRGLFNATQIPYLPEKFVMTDIVSNQFPLVMSQYYFIQEIIKFDAKKSYQYGLYRSQKGELGFAKHWEGAFKDRDYYFLKNEIQATTFVEKLDKQIRVLKKEVIFPKVISSKESKSALTLLTTFSQGNRLENLPIDKKIESIEKVLHYFDELNKDNPNIKNKAILDRKLHYFLALMPYIILMNFLKQPRSITLVGKSLLFILKNLPLVLKNEKYGFVHRDIGEKNILIFNKKNIIYDFQLSCIANPVVDYAIAYLKAHMTSGLKEKVFTKIILKKYPSNNQLRIFFSYTLYLALYELSMLDNKEYHTTRTFLGDVFKEIHAFEKRTHRAKQTQNFFQTNIVKLASSCKKIYLHSVLRKGLVIVLGVFLFAGLLTSYIKGAPSVNGLYYQKELDTKVEGPYEASSSTSRYALVISMVKNHTFFLDQKLGRFAAPDVTYYKGKFFTLFTPGISFLGIPFYIVGNIFHIPQLATYLLTLLVAVGNVFLIAMIVKKFTYSLTAGILAGLTFLFATDGLSYAFTFTQHHASVFILLLAIMNCLSKRSFIQNVLFGLIFGAGLLIDIPNGILLLPSLLFILHQHLVISKDAQNIKLSCKLSVIGLLIGLIPLIMVFGFYNLKTTGSYTKIAQFIGGTADFNITTQNKIVPQPLIKLPVGTLPPIGIPFVFKTRIQLGGIYTLLISKERAWWYYSPVLFLGLLGLYALYKKIQTRKMAVMLVAILLLNIILYSMFGDPWGGWAFGPRYLIPGAAILSIGVGVAISKYAKNIFFSFLFVISLAYSIWVNALGALTTAAIPPQQAAQALNNQIPYTYAYNMQLVGKNVSSSLVYNAFFTQFMSVQVFLDVIVVLTFCLFVLVYLALLRGREAVI